MEYPSLQFNPDENKPIDLTPKIKKPLFVPASTPQTISPQVASQMPLQQAGNFLKNQFNKSQEAYKKLTIPIKGGKRLDPMFFSAGLKAIQAGEQIAEPIIQKVIRYATPKTINTDLARGGTWYELPIKKPAITFKGGQFGAGGSKVIKKELNLKNPLIMNLEKEGYDANDLLRGSKIISEKTGIESVLEPKYKKSLDDIWGLAEDLSDEVMTENQIKKELRWIAKEELGWNKNKVANILKHEGWIDRFQDNIVSEGLSKSGYDGLVLQSKQGTHFFKFPETISSSPQIKLKSKTPVKKTLAKEPVIAHGKAQLKTILGTAGAMTGILGVNKALEKIASKPYTYIKKKEIKPKYSVKQLADAVAYNETGIIPKGKKYSYFKYSGKPELGDDLGKYQITEGELAGDSKKYYGRKLSREEFLNNPRIQDAYIFRKIQYLRKKGYTDEQIFKFHRGGIHVNLDSEKVVKYANKALNYLKKKKIRIKEKPQVFIPH